MGLTAPVSGDVRPRDERSSRHHRRASQTFESVVVGALENLSKQPMFTLEERVGMLKEACADMPNVTVVSFRGLLVDLAPRRATPRREGPAGRLGLRVRDPDGADEPPPRRRGDAVHADEPKWSFLSSSLVKEVATLGGRRLRARSRPRPALADRLEER